MAVMMLGGCAATKIQKEAYVGSQKAAEMSAKVAAINNAKLAGVNPDWIADRLDIPREAINSGGGNEFMPVVSSSRKAFMGPVREEFNNITRGALGSVGAAAIGGYFYERGQKVAGEYYEKGQAARRPSNLSVNTGIGVSAGISPSVTSGQSGGTTVSTQPTAPVVVSVPGSGTNTTSSSNNSSSTTTSSTTYYYNTPSTTTGPGVVIYNPPIVGPTPTSPSTTTPSGGPAGGANHED